jgi:gliding motility-associated-like protein
VTAGSNPLNPCDPDDSSAYCQSDIDGDGVLDVVENINNTDLNDPCSYFVSAITLPITSGVDCDGDGILDEVEISNGTNPFDICDPSPVGIECVLGIHIPTGFSPDGDGQNETLEMIVGKDIKSFTLSVFDRWGNRMIKTSDKIYQWDGTYQGTKVNTGVYAFVLEVIYLNGSSELKSGNITVIR